LTVGDFTSTPLSTLGVDGSIDLAADVSEWRSHEAAEEGVAGVAEVGEVEELVERLVGVTMGGAKPSPPNELKKSPVVSATKRVTSTLGRDGVG